MSGIVERAERLMGMNDDVWMRHMSNWSVWTRMLLVMPLLTLAIWSRVWVGWWAVLAVAVVLAFIWLNPRLFRAPKHVDDWAARGVLGERVWLRKRERVAAHHVAAARVLMALSATGALLWLYGVVQLAVGTTLLGMFATMAFKVWFVDRMAWVWQDYIHDGGTLDDLKA